MASLWARAFSCCVRTRSSQVGPHERTPLIRDTEHSSTTPPLPRVVDHQRMKERLGNIVRSKEGKMVNVNAQIPFNLHNQNLGHRLDPSSSRSTRSRSGANPNDSNQNSRRPSPSPAPSIQLSRSSNSLLHGDVSSSHFSLDNEPKKPLLDVRLVRGVGRRRASSSRVRGRLGKFGEESGREIYVGGDGSSQREEAADIEHDGGQDDMEDLLTPRPLGHVPRWAALQESSPVSTNTEDNTTDASTAPKRIPAFQFQSVGVITRSWSD